MKNKENYKCPGCGRPELHKMCPAWGTPHYMSPEDLLLKEKLIIYPEQRMDIRQIREFLGLDPDDGWTN